jgi:hypothetical protein
MEKVRVTPSFQLGLGICVWKKMEYVFVGHLLPWISPKYVALKNVVYSL